MRPQGYPKATCGRSFSGQELFVFREVGLEEAQKGSVGVVYLVRGIGGALDVHYVPLPEGPISPGPAFLLVEVDLVTEPLLDAGREAGAAEFADEDRHVVFLLEGANRGEL